VARGALARAVLPPLLAFALARAVLGAAAISAGVPPCKPGSWCRFDCAHYVRIALHGYELAPCFAGSHDAGLWCGNAAWLPGYPLLARAGHALGLPPRGAALTVSGAFALATLALLWAALGGLPAGPLGCSLGAAAPPSRAAIAALALAAFFPGAVYAHAISPLGVFGCAAVAALVLAARGRPLAAGLAGAAAAFTYPPGFLLAPVLGAGFLLGPGTLPSRIRRAAVSAGAAASGFAAVLALQQHDTGEWRAFFLVQGSYHYRLQSPLGPLVGRIAPLLRPPLGDRRDTLAAQTLLVALLVGAAVVASLLAARASAFGDRERFVALYVLAAWLLPLVIGEEQGGLHRREATLLPLVMLTVRLPVPVQVALTVVAAVLAYAVALLFFRSQLL
jgi:hypothetical protein